MSLRGAKLPKNIVEHMQKLADEGKTLKEAAEILDIPYPTMKSRSRKHNIKFNSSKNSVWTDEKLELISKLSFEKTAAEIAEIFDTTKRAILNVASKNNIKFTKMSKRTDRSSAEDYKKSITDLAEQGLTLQEAADKLNIPYKTILSRALRSNVKFTRATGTGAGTSEGAYKAWENRSKEDLSNTMTDYWSVEKNRIAQSDRIREVHKRPDYIEKRIELLKGKTSSLEKLFKRILIEDIGLVENEDFEEQFKLGFYAIDFLIKRQGKKDLLIELNGDYWHTLPKSVPKDKAKRTYIVNNFSDKYELKTIWEHEFLSENRIIELLKLWLGKTKTKEISFNDIEFSVIDKSDARSFLEKYHYYSNLGRGGTYFGVKDKDLLIAVAVFSSPHRQNIAQRFCLDDSNILELSRFAIRDDYHVKNLGSWFLARCVKFIKNNNSNIKMLLSYSDMTYNHNGGLYTASGWIKDGTIKPDYWYVDKDNYVIKKQSLYKHAKRMQLTESEFVEQKELIKVWGYEKIRFLKWLNNGAKDNYTK